MFGRPTLNCACYRPIKPYKIWRAFAHSKRFISSSSHTDEAISIPVGGNGSITLKISRPTQPAKNNNVLVYLPPGPFPESSRRDPQVLDLTTLRDAFPDTTVVDLQYRISLRNIPDYTRPARSYQDRHKDETNNTQLQLEDHRFPTPIHDIFAAWSYITDSLQLYNHDVINGKKIYYRPRICLVGSHIGGSLALTLALTNPDVICAVAVVDCLGDWTGLDELAGADGEDGKRRGRKEKSKDKDGEKEKMRLAARELLKLRGRLFRSHSGYFDAFASPVLFLRAPGRDTPVEGGWGVGLEDGEGEEQSGVVMRYGEEVDEVGVVVDGDVVAAGVEGDTGVGVTDAGQAFGPYDDDWVVSGYDEAHRTTEARADGGRDTLGDSAMGVVVSDSDSYLSSATDSPPTSSTFSDQDSIATAGTPPETPSSAISPQSTPPAPSLTTTETPSPPRRRKVLRRWPPVAQPEDVLLPHINLFTTTPSTPAFPLSSPDSPSTTSNDHDPDQDQDHTNTQPIDITPVTTLQTTELQDLLRKACFWGREKGLAEERVVMTRLGGDQVVDGVGNGGGSENERNGDGDGVEGSIDDATREEKGDVERERDREREKVVKWLQMRFDEGS